MNSSKAPLLLILVFLGLSACDLPTKSPDFSFTADVEAPLFFDKSYVFLGPDGSGIDALIDTTRTSFDELFTVSSQSEEIFIIQDIDDFDIGMLDDVLDPISFAPEDIGVTIGDLASPSFSGSATQEVGVYDTSPASSPSVPLVIEGSEAFYPVVVGSFLSPPENDIVDMSGAAITDYIFTADNNGTNALTFVLQNNLSETLTDGSSASGTVPNLVVVNPGVGELSRVPFSSSPSQGQTASAVVDLSNMSLPSTARFQLDVGTTNGFQPISDDPFGLGLAAATSLLRYDGVSVSSLPNQTSIGDSNSDFSVTAELDFVGLVTSSGNVSLVVDNNLPIPINVDEIRLSNIDAVDIYPAGHMFASSSGQSIGPNSSGEVPFNLGATGIGRDIRATVVISSPGSASPVSIYSDNGINFSVTGNAEIDRVYFRPAGEEFSTTGSVDVTVEDVRFDSPSDFVELSSGSLDISDLVNNLDVAMDVVEITFPQIRVAPYGASDSLRIRFQGSSDNPATFTYRELGRNEAPRNISINVGSTRLYPSSGRIDYNVAALAEQTSQVRVLVSSDEISSTIRANQIEIGAIQSSIDPIAFDLSDDANGDGLLDVLDANESFESTLTAINDLADFGFSSLSLSGSELTVEISGNVSASYSVYAAIAGIDDSGNTVYLGGRGATEVAPSDTMASKFVAGGIALDSQSLIKFDIVSQSGSSGSSTVVLSSENSTVDDFINALPGTVRLASRIVVAPNGGQVTLQLPLDLDIGLGASIPLRFRGDASFRKRVSADLSGLDNLTDEEKSVSLDEAILRLGFENAIPLGLEARIHIVDSDGNTTTQIPAPEDPPMTITSAETGEFGTGTTASIGVSELTIDRETLALMAVGDDIEMVLTLSAGQQGVRRVRATDEIKIDLSGEFDLKVSTGN